MSTQQASSKPSGNRNSNSNAMTNGDNSDNSENSRFSLGNNSFGFNFDSEDGSPVTSDAGAKSDEDNSTPGITNPNANVNANPNSNSNPNGQTNLPRKEQKKPVQVVSDGTASTSGVSTTSSSVSVPVPAPQAPLTQENAAAAAHAQLLNIATQSVRDNAPPSNDLKIPSKPGEQSLKRKSSSISSGYKSDDEGQGLAMNGIPSVLSNSNAAIDASMQSMPQQQDQEPVAKGGKKGRVDNSKREERNAREKERSYRITSQINELRGLLSTGGVIVPKGTKNAVLTEAANYIRILQQQQYKSEIHRQQLIQQMQVIGAGQLGPQAANAIRHVAAQNGVWSLGNFGGVPPRSAMSAAAGHPQADQCQSDCTKPDAADSSKSNEQHLIKNIEDHDYRFVFNSCAIGMAIASMGGAFIDCNQLFIQLSEYSKQEICGLTIFNLTAKDDLQNAFDLISQMISPPAESTEFAPTCVLRGSMKNRSDLGLNITLIKDEQGIAKCFCVTLIRSPSSSFIESKPVQATVDFIRAPIVQESDTSKQGNMSSPAFMTG